MRPVVICAVLVTLGCGRDEAKPPAPPPAAAIDDATLARGKALVGELKQTLLGRLTAALAQGAPGAIAVCSGEAPAIAAGLSRDGAVVGRATRRPRNPANAATGWQDDAIGYFETLKAKNIPLAGVTFARRLDANRIAYAEPLVILELCATCHGAAIAPDVQTALAERYPADRATGYAVGDLRGVAWVELPAR